MKKYSTWLTLFALILTIKALGAENPFVNCNVSRVIVPLTKSEKKLTCAASFMFGSYGKNLSLSSKLDSWPNSVQLIERLKDLPEEQRWQYPEYAIIKSFQQWKAGNKGEVLACYEPGYSRNKKNMDYKSMSDKQNKFWEPFKELVFLYKTRFGPYVGVHFLIHEVTDPANGKKGRGFPMTQYLKYVNGRYMITQEIGMTHLFDDITSYCGDVKQYVPSPASILSNPKIALKDMKWVALDVDVASPAESKNVLKWFPTEQKAEMPDSFSENHLQIYFDLEPINLKLRAGENVENLSPEIRFIETALAKQTLGSKAEVLACWSGKSQEYLQKRIEQLENDNAWPETRVYPLGQDPLIIGLLRTSGGTVVYYKGKFADKTMGKAMLTGINEDISLSDIYYMPCKAKDILRDELFMDSIEMLYGSR